jgi:hypothetical protein
MSSKKFSHNFRTPFFYELNWQKCAKIMQENTVLLEIWLYFNPLKPSANYVSQLL